MNVGEWARELAKVGKRKIKNKTFCFLILSELPVFVWLIKNQPFLTFFVLFL